MTVIKTDRIFTVWVRTNQMIPWRYAECGGMYETIEQAIQSATEHFNYYDAFEYRIENMFTDEITTGFINRNK